ncbi:MAG: YitT family protein [Lachnospiraceae bacterium]|nr:YitT family protein [Lachnospiraceae bacterium]
MSTVSGTEHKKHPITMTWEQFLLSVGGSILFALGVNLFIVPSGTYNGGVLGISQLLYVLVQNVAPALAFGGFTSVVYYLLNIPLFILAYREFGLNFFFRTILCVTVETVGLALIPTPEQLLVEDSILTNVVIGGIVAGCGSGLIFRSRSSAGGLDVIGMYMAKKYKTLSVGRLSLCVNAVIYGICALSLNVSVAIYSIIYSAVSSTVVDRLHSQNICTEMLIFTKKDPEKIVSFITQELVRSATYWDGISGYQKDESYVIFTVVSKYEVPRLEAFLKHYDAHAFASKRHGVGIDGNFNKRL